MSEHVPSWTKPEPTRTTKPRSAQTNVGLLAAKPKSPDQPRSWLGERVVRNSWDTVPERDAVRVVEELYGSLEEFGAWCVFDCPEMLDPQVSITKKSELSGVPAGAIACLLARSVKFRGVLRGSLANQVFDVMAEMQHLRVVAGIAGNAGKTVMTKNGSIARVDNSERGVLDAGEYLNKYRGTPMSGGPSGSGNTLVLNFQGAPAGSVGPESGNPELDERTVTVSGREVSVHSPLKAGSLPPKAVRGRYETFEGAAGQVPGAAIRGKDTQAPASELVGSDLDFHGGNASGEESVFGRSEARPRPADKLDERDPRHAARGSLDGPARPDSGKPERRHERLSERLGRAVSGVRRDGTGGFEGYGAGASKVSEGFGEGFDESGARIQPGEDEEGPQKPS